MSRTKQEFVADIESAKQKLREAGADTDKPLVSSDEGRLKADFILPYSSPPQVFTQTWKTNNMEFKLA